MKVDETIILFHEHIQSMSKVPIEKKFIVLFYLKKKWKDSTTKIDKNLAHTTVGNAVG